MKSLKHKSWKMFLIGRLERVCIIQTNGSHLCLFKLKSCNNSLELVLPVTRETSLMYLLEFFSMAFVVCSVRSDEKILWYFFDDVYSNCKNKVFWVTVLRWCVSWKYCMVYICPGLNLSTAITSVNISATVIKRKCYWLPFVTAKVQV